MQRTPSQAQPLIAALRVIPSSLLPTRGLLTLRSGGCFVLRGPSAELFALRMEELVERVRVGDEAAVRAWLEAGGDVNASTREGNTLLSWAVIHGAAGVAALLLDSGASTALANDNGDSPLSWALHGASEALGELLVERGADPNAHM
jgi:hypothetical protein